MAAPHTSLSPTRAAGWPLINTDSLPCAINGGAGCLLHLAMSAVARAAGFPSIMTLPEPLSSIPSGEPKLSTKFVTAELAAAMASLAR
ncbi:hypothetical protein [Xenorhabdus nematophila]|uniref:hypothetical protein n=1 Tax=Xenorhabdus nematophila TaxID=628 RepID=UPI0039BFBCC0